MLGVYRVTKLFFNKSIAGVAAITIVFLSSIIETVHVYGQLPTLTGLAFLLNALPFIYKFIVKEKYIYLVLALSFLSVTICSHHVTAIFGMVFFIAPIIYLALADSIKENDITKSNLQFFVLLFKTAILKYKQIVKEWKSATRAEIWEAIRDNFIFGFIGATLVVFIATKMDLAVLLGYIVYYSFMGKIVNRPKYVTDLGKIVVFPFASAFGAFAGYKLSYLLLQYKIGRAHV